MADKIQRITPNLWFDHQAEEAVRFYVSIFDNAEISKITHYGKEGYEVHGRPEGEVMNVEFQLAGQTFLALNGGPHFTFNEAVSFIIHCENQEEIDYYWDNLSEGGDEQAQQCGWLKDKYGLSWQIVPDILQDLLTASNSEKANRVMRAILQMKKIDISALQEAYNSPT